MQGWLLGGLLLASPCFALAQASPPSSLVPLPASVQPGAGEFVLSPSTRLCAEGEESRANADLLNGALRQQQGWTLRECRQASADTPDVVWLRQGRKEDPAEAYLLHVSLYWQLNDVWPGVSWSSIDWYGRWKPLHFHARRFFAPVAVAALRKDATTRLSLLSDLMEPLQAEWRLRVMDMHGRVLRERRQPAMLAPLAATQVASFTDVELLAGADPRRTVAVFELLHAGRSLSRRIVYFDAPKQLALPDSEIVAKLLETDGKRELRLTAKALARAVWIDFGDLDVEISDSSLDLLPGETVVLTLKSPADTDRLRAALALRSLADAMSAPTTLHDSKETR